MSQKRMVGFEAPHFVEDRGNQVLLPWKKQVDNDRYDKLATMSDAVPVILDPMPIKSWATHVAHVS